MMNNEYDKESGGQREVSESKRSRWHISADTRGVLAVFFGALVVLSAVWGVCDYALSRLDARFDEIDAEFDKIDARFNTIDARFDGVDARFDRQDLRMDRIESTMTEGFRQTHDRIDRTDARIDRLETKVDAIDTFLRQGRPHIPVEGDGTTPGPVANPEGSGGESSWPLRRDR